MAVGVEERDVDFPVRVFADVEFDDFDSVAKRSQHRRHALHDQLVVVDHRDCDASLEPPTTCDQFGHACSLPSGDASHDEVFEAAQWRPVAGGSHATILDPDIGREPPRVHAGSDVPTEKWAPFVAGAATVRTCGPTQTARHTAELLEPAISRRTRVTTLCTPRTARRRKRRAPREAFR
jgi:hypothetical protein